MMVKFVNVNDQKSSVEDVESKPAKQNNSALDDLEKKALENEQSGANNEAKAEQKQEQNELDTLAADVLSALNMAAAPAQPAMWWLSESQFEKLWGLDVRKGIATPAAEVMRRHGLSVGGLLGQYAPYIALLTAVAPSMAATVNMYKQAKQAQLAQPTKAENASA